MNNFDLNRERAVALFLFAVLAISPPLLAIFSQEGRLFGIPILYLYLFSVWALVVLMIALNAFSPPAEGKRGGLFSRRRGAEDPEP